MRGSACVEEGVEAGELALPPTAPRGPERDCPGPEEASAALPVAPAEVADEGGGGEGPNDFPASCVACADCAGLEWTAS